MRIACALRNTRLFCWLIAGAILGACGSSTDDGGGGGGGGGGGEISDQKRYAAFEAITDKIDNLTGADEDARRAELLAYLQGRDEFEAAGVSDDGSLWARFVDGRMLLFVANSEGLPQGQIRTELAPAQSQVTPPRRPSALSALTARVTHAASMAAPAELPASLQARVLGGGTDAGDPFFTGFIPYLSSMLEARGYQVRANHAATIDELLSVSGDGVFYLGSHGGEMPDVSGNKVFGVMTQTTFSMRNDSAYASLWLDGSLIYTVDIDPGIGPPFRRCPAPCLGYYGFTAKFVNLHMGNFANGSVVYIGACTSFNAGFRDAFIAKGAGVYFGWTLPFNADDDGRAVYYLFDRLLGLNDPINPQESPRQRPFDYASVHSDMARPAKHLTTSVTKYGTAQLTYKPGNTESGLLAPSIKFTRVDETSGMLVLTGKFGSDPRASGGGEVRVDDSPLQIESWGKEEIRAHIPLSGPGSAGDVVVWSKGRRSNTRTTTEYYLTIQPAPIRAGLRQTRMRDNWPFNLEFITGEGTLQWKGGVELHIRADLGSYREEAGEDPQFQTVPINIAKDSYGELVASGTSSDGHGWWDGTAPIVARIADPAAPNVIDGVGEIDTEMPYMMRIALYITVTDGLMGHSDDGPDYSIPAVWGSNDGPLNATLPLPSLYLPLNSDFGIIGDQRRQVPEDPSSILYWSDIMPNYIPADSLAR